MTLGTGVNVRLFNVLVENNDKNMFAEEPADRCDTEVSFICTLYRNDLQCVVGKWPPHDVSLRWKRAELEIMSSSTALGLSACRTVLGLARQRR